MDYLINKDELAAMYGLTHIQQLTYLRGIRPYMDLQSGIVGEKRKISYQSLAEEVYVEPHQGFKVDRVSRSQMRRVIDALERAGLIKQQSKDRQLILKCLLASRNYYIQKKADTNPTQQAGIKQTKSVLENIGLNGSTQYNADTQAVQKADIPQENNNYIYLSKQFERFWSLYPQKQSRPKAWDVFINLNPNESLVNAILSSLENQIKSREIAQGCGHWVPPWKYPANWLMQRCWEDEIPVTIRQERKHAGNKKGGRANASEDLLWNSCSDFEDIREQQQTNVIAFKEYRATKKTY